MLHAKRNGILMLGEIDLGDHPRCDSNRFQRYRFRCGRRLGRFAGKGRARVEDFYGFTRMRRHVQRAGRIARLQERTGARIAQHVLNNLEPDVRHGGTTSNGTGIALIDPEQQMCIRDRSWTKRGTFQYSLPRMKPTKAFSPGISSKRLDQALRFAAENYRKVACFVHDDFIIYMNGEACSSFDAERRLTGLRSDAGNEGAHTAPEAGCLR